uniref:Potassium channel domain-containing protein n=1 Tax=Clytia hemisphaerica TaxID=252671 RepID=A0A7M5UKV7_9CNID
MYTLLFIAIISIWVQCSCQQNRTFNYWELKPYIYTDQRTGKLTGMFIEAIEQLKIANKDTCDQYFNRSEYLFQHYRKWDQTIIEANDITRRNWTQNLSPNELANVPLIAYERENGTLVDSYGPFLREPVSVLDELFFSEGIAMISLKYNVEFTIKFFHGFFIFAGIFIYVLLLVLFASLLLLVIDCVTDGIPKGKITKSIGSNIWYIFVTLTSVGYGDIVPKMILTKMLGVIIMVFGLIFASLLTAVVTNFVNDAKYVPYQVVNTTISMSYTRQFSMKKSRMDY